MEKSFANHKLAFIGLGLMGKPMARHLHAAGATVTIHNRSRAVVDELTAEGLTPAASPAEIAANHPGGVIAYCLPRTENVRDLMEGPEGLLAHLTPGTLLIDLGTIATSYTRDLDALLREKHGASLLDAPVSGGQVGAEAANLTIMCGGSDEDFQRALPLLEVIGQKITHMGPSGSGQVTKMANQVIVALTIGAVSEALALAETSGVDPAKVREAIGGGFAASRILELHGERMVNRDWTPGGRSELQLKDVREALALASDHDLDLPALQNALPLWERLVNEGGAHLDHSALFKLYDPREKSE